MLARNLFMSGKTIYIDHGGGILTGYYHLSEFDALEGETVKRGAAIGKVGETGRTTGPCTCTSRSAPAAVRRPRLVLSGSRSAGRSPRQAVPAGHRLPGARAARPASK